MTDVPGESRGVAFTNWLVNKAAGVLEKTSSRRGFLIGSAMAGSAVAVAGCAPVTMPGSTYNHITDCSGSLCNDGYTEFCCTINNGVNACPDGSFAGGWWRADYSTFCNGTRYYIDCMQNCCGPNLGNGFCAGCTECRCAGGCDTRRVYCNYFRYGQCHQEIGITGPIACRVVTCTPPYQDASLACTTVLAVDNGTAEHAPAHNCAPTTLPGRASVLNALGTAALVGPAQFTVFARSNDNFIHARTRSNGTWSQWSTLPPAVTSGLATAGDSTGMYIVGRGIDSQLRYNRLAGGVWTGEGALSGVTPSSNPCIVGDASGVRVFVRGANKAVSTGAFVHGTWSGWASLGGSITSNPCATASPSGTFVFGRGNDNTLVYGRLGSGGWSGWSSLGGTITSDPSAVTSGSAVYVFVRSSDNRIWAKTSNGGSFSDWFTLYGNADSDPVAVTGPDGVYVFVRAADGSAWVNRQNGGTWTGFQPLGGTIDGDITCVSDPASGVNVFARHADATVWTGTYSHGYWTGWFPLGGSAYPTNALS
jgi:hypothetical protein